MIITNTLKEYYTAHGIHIHMTNFHRVQWKLNHAYIRIGSADMCSVNTQV